MKEKETIIFFIAIIMVIFVVIWGVKTEADAATILVIFVALALVLVISWRIYKSFLESRETYLDEVIFAEKECLSPNDKGFRFLMSEAMAKIIVSLERMQTKLDHDDVSVQFYDHHSGEPRTILAETHLSLRSEPKFFIQQEIGILLAKKNIKECQGLIIVKNSILIDFHFNSKSRHVVAQARQRGKEGFSTLPLTRSPSTIGYEITKCFY